MPSPFPGMDPYLESFRSWRDFQLSFIYCCNRALNRTLPRELVACLDERVYLEDRGEITESFITITPARQPDHIITAIEVLSPKNKQPGAGRRSYQQKQYEFFESGVHLLEIDLLRGGAHTVAVSERRLQERYGSWDYLVCLSRADRRFEYDVWRLTLRDRLPRVLVPLLGGHPDIALDLQEALDQAYEEGAFDRSLNYRTTPVPTLSEEDSVWANSLLQAKGVV